MIESRVHLRGALALAHPMRCIRTASQKSISHHESICTRISEDLKNTAPSTDWRSWLDIEHCLRGLDWSQVVLEFFMTTMTVLFLGNLRYPFCLQA